MGFISLLHRHVKDLEHRIKERDQKAKANAGVAFVHEHRGSPAPMSYSQPVSGESADSASSSGEGNELDESQGFTEPQPSALISQGQEQPNQAKAATAAVPVEADGVDGAAASKPRGIEPVSEITAVDVAITDDNATACASEGSLLLPPNWVAYTATGNNHGGGEIGQPFYYYNETTGKSQIATSSAVGSPVSQVAPTVITVALPASQGESQVANVSPTSTHSASMRPTKKKGTTTSNRASLKRSTCGALRVDLNSDEEFTVERILCSRQSCSTQAKGRGKLEYRVRWKGSWPTGEKETWEPGSSLVRLARLSPAQQGAIITVCPALG